MKKDRDSDDALFLQIVIANHNELRKFMLDYHYHKYLGHPKS